jgi:filamentous hemagglutinin family protein
MTANTKNRRRTLQLGTALATCLAYAGGAQVAGAQDIPTNPVIISGGLTAGDITTVPNTSVNVDLKGANAVVHWNTFNLNNASNSFNVVSTVPDGSGGTMADATARTMVNQVVGTLNADGGQTISASLINGVINASNPGGAPINFWLINPAGITFGATGTFSGNSLVLSTLPTGFNFAAAGANPYGTAVSFSPATVGPNDVLPAAADRTINLSAGSKLGTAASPLAGGVLVVAQEITAGGEIHAAGKVGLVAASDVSFPSGVGSPLSFVITTGTTLKGVHVLGSADINGAAVVVGAVSKTTALDNLLQVDNAKLTATSGTDGITLTTVSRLVSAGAPAVAPGKGDGIAVASGASLTTSAGTGAPVEIIADGALSFDGNIASNGAASLVSLNTSTTNSVAADNANLDVGASANITSVGNLTIMAAGTGGKAVSLQHNSASGSTGLKATGATGNVLIDAGTLDLVQAADVASASDYTVNAKSVILGNGATPVTQSAVGKVRISTTSAAGITGEQGLTLRSNATNEDSGNTLILDANDDGSGGPFGVINFAQGSLISAGDSSDVTKNAAIGLRFDRTPLDPLDPTHTVPQLTLGSARGYQIGDFDGTDINVPLTGEGAFTAQFITTDNPFLAAFKDAISITGSVKTAGSDIRLSAGKDLLVANAATTLAADPVATPPTAGSIMLQAGGKITSNGALIAGEDVLARSIGVAQLGTVRAGDDIAVSATAAITVTNAITRAAINGTGDASFDDAQAGTAAGITPTSLAPADRSNILLSSAGDVTLTNASAGATGAFGSIALLSGGAVRSSGTLTAREDVQVRSVGLTDLNAVTAGDDIVVWSGGTLDLVDGQTTGAGSDARTVTFNTANAGKPGSITFAALDPYGASNILLSAATDLTVTDATIGGAGASGTIALLSGGTADSTGTLTALEDVQVRSGGAATLGTLKAGDDIYVHSDSTIDLTSAETTGSGSNGRTVNFAAPASAGQVGSITFVAPDNNAALTPGANIVLEGTGLGGTAPTEVGLSLGNTDTASPFVTGEAQLIADTGDIRIGTLSADTSDIFVQAQQGSITGLAVSGFTPTTGMTLTSAGNVVLNTGYATVGSITANSGSVTSNGSATAIRIGRVDAASVDLSTTSLLRIDAGDVAGLTRLHTTGGAPNATFVPGLDTLAPAFSDANLSVTGAGSTITVDGANALLLDGVHAPVVKLGAVSANVAPLLGNQVFVDGYDVSVGSVRAQGDIRVQSNTDLLTGNFGEDTPVVAGDTPGLFSSANGDVTLVASAGSVHGRSRAAQTFGTGFGAIHADGDLSVDTATPGYGDFRVNSLTAGGDISLDIAGSLYGYGNAPSVSGAKLQALNGAVSVTAGDTINLKEIESPFPISLDAQHVGIETVTLNSAAPTTFFFSTSGFAAPNVYVGQLRSNRNLRVTGDFGPRAMATAAGLVTPTLTFAALGTNKTTLSADGTISGSVGDAAQIDTATAGVS